MKARYGVGVGARKTFDAAELAALVREVALRHEVDFSRATLAALKTHQNAEAVSRIAETLGMSFALLGLEDLRSRRHDVLTRSPRIEALYGVGSLSEALALAAVGEGSRLLAPRVATARLTCAIARGDDA